MLVEIKNNETPARANPRAVEAMSLFKGMRVGPYGVSSRAKARTAGRTRPAIESTALSRIRRNGHRIHPVDTPIVIFSCTEHC